MECWNNFVSKFIANPIFLLLTPAKPNCAISILAANYEHLLLWQLARKYILNVGHVTASAYGDWGLVPPKHRFYRVCPLKKSNFGRDNKKIFLALRTDLSPPLQSVLQITAYDKTNNSNPLRSKKSL